MATEKKQDPNKQGQDTNQPSQTGSCGYSGGQPPKGGSTPTPTDVIYEPSEWTKPVDVATRTTILAVIKDKATRDVVAEKTKDIDNPIELRAQVVRRGIRGERTQQHLATVRSVIAAGGGRPQINAIPDLPEAVLHQVYAELGTDVSPRDVLDHTDLLYEGVNRELLEDKVFEVLSGVHSRPPADEVEQAAALLISRRVPFDSPKFGSEVFAAFDTLIKDRKFDKFFDPIAGDIGKNGGSTTRGQDGLGAERKRSAIRFLRDLGVDPDRASDDDWGRIALGALGTRTSRRDIMAVADYGLGTELDGLDAAIEFPDFETERTIGLIPENIRTLADLYYIYQFDRMGIFDTVKTIGIRFFDGLNLGLSDTGFKLYQYIKRLPRRFPEEDVRRVTSGVFEGEHGRGSFDLYMGRMVEALIEYQRVRNAGELFTTRPLNGSGLNRAPSAYTQAAVFRAIENLQRYLSDAGGGITHYLTREVGAQLLDCFDILDSPDLQQYFGGGFNSGMFSIIEEIQGEQAQVDRRRTLAVHGRQVLVWLSDNASNVGVLADTDLDQLSLYVEKWLAGYLRPSDEIEWLGDGEDEYDESDAADEAIRSALDESGADILVDVP